MAQASDVPLVHKEAHLIARIGWLRAAVPRAVDRLLSTASLIVGVASASGDRRAVMVAGLAHSRCQSKTTGSFYRRLDALSE